MSYAKCEGLFVHRRGQSLGANCYRKAIGRMPRANNAFTGVFQDTTAKQTAISEKKLPLDLFPRMAPPHSLPEVVRLRKDRPCLLPENLCSYQPSIGCADPAQNHARCRICRHVGCGLSHAEGSSNHLSSRAKAGRPPGAASCGVS